MKFHLKTWSLLSGMSLSLALIAGCSQEEAAPEANTPASATTGTETTVPATGTETTVPATPPAETPAATSTTPGEPAPAVEPPSAAPAPAETKEEPK